MTAFVFQSGCTPPITIENVAGPCAVCTRFRPLFEEPDGTMVCEDDYFSRNLVTP